MSGEKAAVKTKEPKPKKQLYEKGTRVRHKKLGTATIELTNFKLHPGLDESYIFIKLETFDEATSAEVVLVDVEALTRID